VIVPSIVSGGTLSRELRWGTLLGKGSVDVLLDALEKSLGGKWARILPYLQECGIAGELELVASINYLLGKPFELTPPLKARIAACIMRNPRLLAALEKLLVEEGEGGEGYEYE